jgi:hypothetical protein
MRKLTRAACLLAAAAAAMLAGAAVPAAGNVTAIPLHFGNKFVCSFRTTNAGCMAANGVSGDKVNSATFDPNSTNQHVDSVQASNTCNNGFVSSSQQCPFTPGLDLNVDLNGDEIVTIDRNASPSVFFRGNALASDVTQGAAENWVINGDCSSGGPCEFIPVGATNALAETDHFEAVCDEGAGSALSLEALAFSSTGSYPSRCEWETLNG